MVRMVSSCWASMKPMVGDAHPLRKKNVTATMKLSRTRYGGGGEGGAKRVVVSRGHTSTRLHFLHENPTTQPSTKVSRGKNVGAGVRVRARITHASASA